MDKTTYFPERSEPPKPRGGLFFPVSEDSYSPKTFLMACKCISICPTTDTGKCNSLELSILELVWEGF